MSGMVMVTGDSVRRGVTIRQGHFGLLPLPVGEYRVEASQVPGLYGYGTSTCPAAAPVSVPGGRFVGVSITCEY